MEGGSCRSLILGPKDKAQDPMLPFQGQGEVQLGSRRSQLGIESHNLQGESRQRLLGIRQKELEDRSTLANR